VQAAAFAVRPVGAVEAALARGAPTRYETAPIRHELVARIRREIEQGTYDTEEKWLLAEDRLLEHVAG
jgi:hypothetical protein